VTAITARPIDVVAPPRLGRSFRWLLASTIVNNAGDGVAVSAGPLLVASQTREPFLVSLALLMEYLPVLLFGVIGGVAADRFDRRRMVVGMNLARSFVLAVLVATIVTGAVKISAYHSDGREAVLAILGPGDVFGELSPFDEAPRSADATAAGPSRGPGGSHSPRPARTRSPAYGAQSRSRSGRRTGSSSRAQAAASASGSSRPPGSKGSGT